MQDLLGFRSTTFHTHQAVMNWSPLNITVRVGCNIAYHTPVPTPALFVLKPRLEGHVLVMQEKLSFGIGQPSYEFQDSHGNITYRSMLMPGRNEIRHDALVAVSSLPDNRDVPNQILPVSQLPAEVLRYTLPSRYCDSDKLLDLSWQHFGHLPDIGCIDPGTPMDFHAYFEVYLGHEWFTFDPRFNVPRIGRVKVAHGADAVDGAFTTIYGAAALVHFEVWAYQVDPRQVSVGDPIDLSKRLDSSMNVRIT